MKKNIPKNLFFVVFILLIFLSSKDNFLRSQNDIVVNNVQNGIGTTTTITLHYNSSGNYYSINNVLDLRALSMLVFQDDSSRDIYTKLTYNKTFKLTQDIIFDSIDDIFDFDSDGVYESNFLPIGGWISDSIFVVSTPSNITIPNIDTIVGMKNSGLCFFAGTFDGNNHKIVGLKVKASTIDNDERNNYFIGLFGLIVGKTWNKATIKNLTIVNEELSGYQEIGGICGSLWHGKIENCNVTSANIIGYKIIGGITGYNYNDALINKSYVTNSVIDGKNEYIGGLCGENHIFKEDTSSTELLHSTHLYSYFYSKINNSYVNNITLRGSLYVGGICGVNYGEIDNNNPSIRFAQINNCYSNCYITRDSNSSNVFFGGIVGKNYNNYSVVKNCYYNSCWNINNINGISENNNITINNSTIFSLDTSIMKNNISIIDSLNYDSSTFKLDNYPLFNQNNGYPILSWQIYNIKNNQTLIIAPSYNGSLPDNIELEEDADFINITNHDFNAIKEQNMNINSWTYVGNVLKNSSVATYLDFIGNNTYLNTYNLPIKLAKFNYNNNSWQNDMNNNFIWLNNNSIFSVGEGTMAYTWDLNNLSNKGITKIYQQDTLFNCNSFNLNLSNQGQVSNGGGVWFSLANPYPAKMSVYRFFYLNQNNIQNVQGDVVYTYNNKTNSYSAHREFDQTNYLKAGEGFFVASSNNTPNLSICFSKNQLANNPYSNIPPPTNPFKNDSANTITITATSNDLSKEAYIRMDNSFTNGFDKKDAYVLLGNNDSLSEPYFVVDNIMILVNSIKTTPYECQMNIHSNINTSISLTFNGIPNNINMYLIDNGISTTITNGSIYTTNISIGENNNRFIVRLLHNSSIDNVSEENNISMWVYDKTININGTNLQELNIYNILGKEVYKEQLAGNIIKEQLSLQDGTYIAKVKANNEEQIMKFTIAK